MWSIGFFSGTSSGGSVGVRAVMWACCLISVLCCTALLADDLSDDFLELSLEQLGDIKVISVSKKSEGLLQAPAAVSVITGDDIRRSGAQTISQALLLVPGVQVASVDSRQSAVTVRGFNDTFAQKLLVLIDGRSVYSPLFSGTYWQVQDTLLEDIDRVEVVRGPGGSVWGANAVNGVINIVTKPAKETLGLVASGGGGSEHQTKASVRYGAQIGESAFFRAYGKHDVWGDSELMAGGDSNDAWSKSQGGFRMDWDSSEADQLTLQGDIYATRGDSTSTQLILPVFGVPAPPTGYQFPVDSRTRQRGFNILGRWSRQISDESEFRLQTYFDRSTLESRDLEDRRSTYDVDFQHRVHISESQELVWGGGFRSSRPDIKGGVEVQIGTISGADEIFNLFIQDEIRFKDDRIRLTLGTKVEHNDYTGYEVQPSMRLAFVPNPKQTVWFSIARAVRTPSQAETLGELNLAVLPPDPPTNPLPTVVSASGSSKYESENLVAYEFGHRIQVYQRVFFDTTLFLNDYTDLRGSDQVLDTSTAPNYVRVVSVANNSAHGQTYGGELAVTWQAAEWWRVYGQFSSIRARLYAPRSSLTGDPQTPAIASPGYQTSLRSRMDLGRDVELEMWLRYVDEISAAGVAIPGLASAIQSVPDYTSLDIRLGWRPSKTCEFTLVGQDLLQTHSEFVPTFGSNQQTEVGPSVFGSLTWRFSEGAR